MAKATLEFNLDEPFEKSAFKRACNATDAYLVIHSIANELFRPNRKHGYPSDRQVQKATEFAEQNSWTIFDSEADGEYNIVSSAVDDLETQFYEILEQYDISLNDLE